MNYSTETLTETQIELSNASLKLSEILDTFKADPSYDGITANIESAINKIDQALSDIVISLNIQEIKQAANDEPFDFDTEFKKAFIKLCDGVTDYKGPCGPMSVSISHGVDANTLEMM